MHFDDFEICDKRAAHPSAEIYALLRARKDFGFKNHIPRAGLSEPTRLKEWRELQSKTELTSWVYSQRLLH